VTQRHVPIRTCMGCRKRRPKSEMLRLTAHGIDRDGRSHPGRGFYLCPDTLCLKKGLTRPDVKKRLGGLDLTETLKSLAVSAGMENHVDGLHPGRVISDKCHGGGSFG
jgi:predicted RNA-binding protein YlxR (DUF448 family)